MRKKNTKMAIAAASAPISGREISRETSDRLARTGSCGGAGDPGGCVATGVLMGYSREMG
jgi:hypothetical protein